MLLSWRDGTAIGILAGTIPYYYYYYYYYYQLLFISQNVYHPWL